jgi:guanylate kinase
MSFGCARLLEGLIIIVSGPSGVGKDTVLKKMLNLDSNLRVSVSVTTRHPRIGEIDGKDYFFLSKDNFFKLLKNDEFLEYTCYCGNFYGTLARSVDNLLLSGKDVILKIDVSGSLSVSKNRKNVLSIFILPPSLEVLSQRLRKRGLDDETEIKKRLEQAKSEMDQAARYKFSVTNKNSQECALEILNIIKNYKNLYL